MALVAPNRRVLLLHDGELKDVQNLMAELGAQCVAGAPDNPSEIEAFDLVVVTPRHLQELPARRVRRRMKGAKPPAVRVAVIDGESKTLSARIRRTGVDVLVKRPVHPRALRLLLLHQLCRGPERRARRVPVGIAVSLRIGLRKHRAILADLSTTGCQLLTSAPLRTGQTFVLYLQRKGTGRLFAAKARVVRLEPAASPNETTVAAAFVSRSSGARKRIQAVMDAFLEGPATLPGIQPATATATAAALPEIAQPADSEPVDEIPDIILGPELILPETIESTPASEPAAAGTAERRNETRRLFERRVVALDEQAARVLVGRDLSAGGMRVDRSDDLEVGRTLTVALHAAAGEAPLVVPAEVIRDDGAAGMVLAFRDLSQAAERYLEKIVDSLPALAREAGDAADQSVVISEIVSSD